jgi:hypothetical protein
MYKLTLKVIPLLPPFSNDFLGTLELLIRPAEDDTFVAVNLYKPQRTVHLTKLKGNEWTVQDDKLASKAIPDQYKDYRNIP